MDRGGKQNSFAVPLLSDFKTQFFDSLFYSLLFLFVKAYLDRKRLKGALLSALHRRSKVTRKLSLQLCANGKLFRKVKIDFSKGSEVGVNAHVR